MVTDSVAMVTYTCYALGATVDDDHKQRMVLLYVNVCVVMVTGFLSL